MLRYIIWTFIFYWLFRFIFNFLVPVFRATSQMKQKVREFQSAQNNNASSTPPPGQEPQQRPAKGDYIDFEEVK